VTGGASEAVGDDRDLAEELDVGRHSRRVAAGAGQLHRHGSDVINTMKQLASHALGQS
jgi:hypothetical protein